MELKRPSFVSESFLFRHWSQSCFDSKDSEINFDRTRSTTVNPLSYCCFDRNLQYFKRRRGRPLCGRAACVLGMDSKVRSGGVGKRKAGKKTHARTALDDKFDT